VPEPPRPRDALPAVTVDDVDRLALALRPQAPQPWRDRREQAHAAHHHLRAVLGWRHRCGRAVHLTVTPLLVLLLVGCVLLPPVLLAGLVRGQVGLTATVLATSTLTAAAAVSVVVHTATERWRRWQHLTAELVGAGLADEIIRRWLVRFADDVETAAHAQAELLHRHHTLPRR